MLSETKLNELKQLLGNLSHEEALWTSGYIAAFAEHLGGRTQTLPENFTTLAVAGAQKITLAYGTETGNSKKLATELAGILKKKGLKVKLTDLAQYKTKDLKKEEFFFVIVSTQGEGEPPLLVQRFYKEIHQADFSISQMKYGVLALGDRSYPLFCQTGEDLDAQLEVLGAQRILSLRKCDADYHSDALHWAEQIPEVVQENSSEAVHPKVDVPTAAPARKKYQGKVSAIVNLNDIDSDKETFHIEIETKEEIRYLPGDALGIIPSNPPEVVREIITLTGIDPETVIETPQITASAEELLLKHLNISYLLKLTIRQYAEITGHSIPEIRISLLDLLRIYPVRNAEEFKEIIPVLTAQSPRLYSVSSSPEAHGSNEIHITVAKSKFLVGEEVKTGLCSGLLSGFTEGDEVEFYIQEARHFRLPEPDRDIVMIGPGTGIAPFRSFLWERDATGAEGRNWLFFGDRTFVSDFLYQSEIIDFIKTGTLTQLDVAFSRDTAQKIYVQHRLEEKSAEIFEWLENGASLYICGAKNPMCKDVEHTLKEIIQKHGKRSQQEAEEYLEILELNGRYAKDVY